MKPGVSAKEKMSSKEERMSVCSCDECDTLRCFVLKNPTNNKDYDDEDFSKTCIYYTNFTIKRNSSKADISTNDNSGNNPKNKKSTESDCGRNDKSVNNTHSDSKTKRTYKDIPTNEHANTVGNGSTPAKITRTININVKRSKTDIDRSEILQAHKINIKDSECKVTGKNSKIMNNANNTTHIDKIHTNNTMSEFSTRNMNKVNNNTDIDNNQCTVEEKIHTRESKCKCRDYQGKRTGATKNLNISKHKSVDRKSICKFCKNEFLTSRNKDAVNCKNTHLEKDFTTHNMSKVCKGEVDPHIKTGVVHGGWSINNANMRKLPCKLSRRYKETHNKIKVIDNAENYDNSKKCSEIKTVSQHSNSCPRHTVELTKKSLIPSGKTLICNCKNVGNINITTNMGNEESSIKFHDTLVTSLRKDLNSSTAKLSAQIMNMPYEEFQESLKLNDRDIGIAKNKISNTLSNDIIKRIKDVYNACSCKVCECISGKTLKSENICKCKPCECEDCKLFKNLNYPNEIYLDVTNKVQNQSCGCTPCDCIKCKPARTFIAARVSEQHQADCSCSPCRCLECERNFFSLSTHLTHEMSTGMVRPCGCEQCLDQRCRGAGGTDECRCEMPNKAIFKPVQQDSPDYDIRHASVYYPTNDRENVCHNTIAMYASVLSNYTQLGTLQEVCSCEECECIACKNGDSKPSIETILRPQSESITQTIQTNTCICKDCECKICSYEKLIPDCYVKFLQKGCVCDECDCINCQTMGKFSTNAKIGALAKPIGKIHYNNDYLNDTLQERDDYNQTVTGSSRAIANKPNQHTCMRASVKDCIKKSTYNPIEINHRNREYMPCQDNDINEYSFTKIRSVSRCSAEHLNTSLESLTSNKNIFATSNYFDYNTENYKVESMAQYHSNVDDTINKYKNDKVSKISAPSVSGTNKYENKTRALSSSHYKPDSSNVSLKTCLKDILTFNADLNDIKFGSNLNMPNAIYKKSSYVPGDIGSYVHMVEPISRFRHNLHSQKFSCDDISSLTERYIGLQHLPNNKIDYKQVDKILKEAKDFSAQLKDLLNKYEKANNDFQSLSDKLILSGELPVLDTLHADHTQSKDLLVEKQRNDYNNHIFLNSIKDLNDRLSDNLCNHSQINENATDFPNCRSALNTSLIVSNEPNKNGMQKKQRSLENNVDLSKKREHLSSYNNTEICDGKTENTDIDIKEKETPINATELKELVDNHPTVSYSIIAKDSTLEEVKTLSVLKEDETTTKSSKNYTDVEITVPKNASDNNQTIESKITTPTLVVDRSIAPQNVTQNKIDILTNQLSDMIKENVTKNYQEKPQTEYIMKYNRSITVSDDLKSIGNDIGKCQSWSVKKKNYYINNQPTNFNGSLRLLYYEEEPKVIKQSMSVQTPIERQEIQHTQTEKLIKFKSAASIPRNKTTSVEKESDTRIDFMVDKTVQKKSDHNSLKSLSIRSWTEVDDHQSQSGMMQKKRSSNISRPKCSYDDFKVCSLAGRRVSDHTVMVKWSKPKEMNGVLGYELLVDGRPVQKIIGSARCMAVVTCLPNCDKVLLTMRTIVSEELKSRHQPTVTIIYRPRLKRNKSEV